jgi:glycosyltransferase involved in cell wall biosynthesis
MQVQDLRVALFSGNYNYVRDGANQALNRLVGYLLKSGAAVRVYSPVVPNPDFPPTGDLIGVPSFALPRRPEYRVPYRLGSKIRADIDRFKPNLVHVSSPEFLGHAALGYARSRNVPVVASMHTRFETYPRYYGLGFLEPAVIALLRRFYRRCDAVVTPSESMAQVMRDYRMGFDVGIWTRGIERTTFNPQARDLAWRRALGFADNDVVIGFFGRLVMEKGLDVFCEVIERIQRADVSHKVLVIGEGPAREWFATRLPNAVFTGFLMNGALGRAVASMDVLFNPSTTEAFGNVTNEVMACGIPVVAARATGSTDLVHDGETGRLLVPGAISEMADAVIAYCTDPSMRAAHGAAAFKATERYDWDTVNQELVDTYLWIMANHAHGLGPPKPGPWGFE